MSIRVQAQGVWLITFYIFSFLQKIMSITWVKSGYTMEFLSSALFSHVQFYEFYLTSETKFVRMGEYDKIPSRKYLSLMSGNVNTSNRLL